MKSHDVVLALEALAQESRLAIFRLLIQTGVEGHPAGHIAERIGLPAPTLSFHLAQLKHAGLISCRRDGRSLYYSANYDEMNKVVAFLTENCCGSAARHAPACSPSQLKSKDKRRRAHHG